MAITACTQYVLCTAALEWTLEITEQIIAAASININSLAATKSKQWHSLQMFISIF